MKTLTLAGGAYVTGNEIADAVLHFSLALTRRQDVDFVDIPFVAADGMLASARLIVGWQTGVAVISNDETVRSHRDDLLDVETILSLYARVEALGVGQAQAFGADELDDVHWPLGDRDYLI